MTTPNKLSRLRIVVLGYLVRFPLGGMAWHHLQYAVGLDRLGHDVLLLEDSEDYESCYDPIQGVMTRDPAVGLRFAAQALAPTNLADRWCYYDAHTSRFLGPMSDRIRNVCSQADLVLNLGGVNPLRAWTQEVPIRAFIDQEPTFTQIRHLTDPVKRTLARQHTTFLSFGENIGTQPCSVPDDGFPWRPTRQPIVLDAWPVRAGPREGRFTTVMQWDSHRPLRYRGISYGMKSHSFDAYIDLPRRRGPIFELAVGSPTAPRASLRAHGWSLSNPLTVTRSLWTYRRYLRHSKGELSIAKSGYVTGASGWFSERSAAYLASGRPVLTEDTGFRTWLPTGDGVIPFTNINEAADGVDDILARYRHHCREARAVAEAYFDARKVLPELLEAAMDPRPSAEPHPAP